ncbi:hypothetical protein [Streptomyces sp. CRN 30]|uniref:hypothetical protein n=1 Tax=Streptomyces sp. CRN 30 TaxID=3075613 RepID=UPI002A8185B0|nr:hypothetical protein [Streptomyces sp. CRN 30]
MGALVGAGMFAVTGLTGRTLYMVTGAVAGAVAVTGIQLYGKAARLTEVKITVPQLSEFTFVVNSDARQVAWELFVETVTRVSTQPLATGEGIVREALTSLHGLFASTRETLKGTQSSQVIPSGQTVEHLAITMLNRELRPFLSAWHPRLRTYELSHPENPESSWPDNDVCRAELHAVQEHIHTYALGFARLAGVRDATAMLDDD